MEIAFGLDFEPEASVTYRANFPEANFIEGDIAAVEVDAIVEAIDPTRRPILLSACAPCQPYSTFVGSSRRDPRRSLLLKLIPIIEKVKPEFIFVENVPGLRMSNANASTFKRFCKALRLMGYEVASEVVDCHRYGVPQRRRRLVILASLIGPIRIPTPSHGTAPGEKTPSTVWEWIGHLPALAAGEEHPGIPNHLASALTPRNLERLRATPPGGNRFDWPDELQLDCHRDHAGHSDVYGRMHADGLAPVLTTKCTSISNGRFGHPFEDRPISVREAACLQTFPEDFIFEGGIKSTTRQVGNAVPVMLARHMGEAFVDHRSEHIPTSGGQG
jgi:DNA (cytosine-5)-methyltransferase 1